MCADHLRSLLMTTPRTLAEDTNSNSLTPSMATWEKQGGVRLKHVRMSLYLIGCSCRWFSWDQSWTKSAACCRVLCLEGGTPSETVVSSANFHMWNPPGRRRSFIIARNSHGPKQVPETLQQARPTNRKTLHSLSPSAVYLLEDRRSLKYNMIRCEPNIKKACFINCWFLRTVNVEWSVNINSLFVIPHWIRFKLPGCRSSKVPMGTKLLFRLFRLSFRRQLDAPPSAVPEAVLSRKQITET